MHKPFIRVAIAIALYLPLIGASPSSTLADTPPTAHSAEDIQGHPLEPPPPPPSPPPPPPPECTYMMGVVDWLWFASGDRRWRNLAQVDDKTGVVSDAFQYPNPAAANYKCVQNLVNDAYRECARGQDIRWDDCLAVHVARIAFPDWVNGKQKVGTHSNGAVCDMRFTYVHWPNYCAQGHFFFDASDPTSNTCRVVPESEIQSTCDRVPDFGVVFIESCPVSLLWTANADIESETTITSFPLNGSGSKPFSAWKGSADTPLVVYDPDHKGKITSAAQLFGHWTFGGKRLASLKDVQAPVRWNNGFEALATQDADGDGRISGVELEPLALWFDANRDGVSQPGEVKPMSEAGVTSLFFTPDREDPATGNLYATVGFEREVSGRRTRGGAVDWQAASADSPLDLIRRYANWPPMYGDAPAKTGALNGAKLAIPAPPEQAAAAKHAGAASISGVWKWEVDLPRNETGKYSRLPDGYLVFADTQERPEFAGYSIAEAFINVRKNDSLRSYTGLYGIEGKRNIDADGRLTLDFVTRHFDNLVHNKAVLSQDGERLKGVSSVNVQEDGKLRKITYSWEAVRYRPE